MADGPEPNATPPAPEKAADTPADTGQAPTGTQKDGGQEPQGKTPETFGRDYVESLRSENASTRTKLREAEAKLEEAADKDRSEVERAAAKAGRETKRADEAEAKLNRYEVAREKKLPHEYFDLLTASSREDLEKQADLILDKLKDAGGEKPSEFGGGPRVPAPEPKTPEEAHNDLLVGLFTGSAPQPPTQ